MSSIKYLIDSLGFVVSLLKGPVPAGGQEYSAPKDLGPLILSTDKGHRTYRFKVVEGEPQEQTIEEYFHLSEGGDILGIYTAGSLERKAQQGTLATSNQLASLQEKAQAEFPFDQEFQLPLFHLKNGKVVKKRNLFDTPEKCEKALGILNARMEAEIAQVVPTGVEMKLAKAYMQWILEGQPKKDARQTRFQEMETKIQEVKDRYKAVRSKIKKELAKTDK